MSYQVYVDSHSNYMERSERSKYDEFEREEEAILACKKIVEGSLQELHKSGMTPRKFFALYLNLGDDPFIVGDEGKTLFSSFDYAGQRCDEICDKDMYWFPPD